MTEPERSNIMVTQVVSLYDFTGEACVPWAEAGYKCFCYDIQHGVSERTDQRGITYRFANLYDKSTLNAIIKEHQGEVAIVLGFPPCDDLAVSGAAHFARKLSENPLCQINAVENAKACAVVADALGAPYAIENPVSVMATIWRKPDFYFDPADFGGYIPIGQEIHPTWPDYIAARDAYPKKTGIWCGNGFAIPERKPVPLPPGYSTQHKKLGGKSLKTKNIRSATPRGFASAVFEANKRN